MVVVAGVIVRAATRPAPDIVEVPIVVVGGVVVRADGVSLRSFLGREQGSGFGRELGPAA